MKKLIYLLITPLLYFNYLFGSETVVIENLRIDKGYILNFTAMNARFEGIVSSGLTSSFHEGMELEVIETEVLEKNEFGRYRLSARFLNPETQKEVVLTSKWMGGDVLVQEVTQSSNQIQWKSHVEYISDRPGYGSGPGLAITVSEVTSWKINFTLQDGSSFVADYRFEPGQYYMRGNLPKPNDPFFDRSTGGMSANTNIISPGDIIEIVAEEPGSEDMRINCQSHFVIKNVTKNFELSATGDTHFVEGFGRG